MITSDLAFQDNFANEGGVGKTNRLSKNIVGLWLLQEFQHQLRILKKYRTFKEMENEAENIQPFTSIINPDDDHFFEPGDIVKKIQTFCREYTNLYLNQLVRCHVALWRAWHSLIGKL